MQAPAAATASRCVPGRPSLVAADSRAEVYLPDGEYEGSPIAGCVYGHRGDVSLGRTFEPPPAGNGPGVGNAMFALAGTLVAYEVGVEPDDAYVVEHGKWLVVVRDLRTGRVVHEAPSGTPTAPDPTEPAINENPGVPPAVVPGESVGSGPLTAIALSPDGSVAWIASNRNEDLRTHCACYSQVHLLDATGARTLASGAGVDPGTLSIVAGRVYWSQDGHSRSVALRGARPGRSRSPAGGRCAPVNPSALLTDERAQIFGEAFGCAYGHRGVYPLGDGPGSAWIGYRWIAYVPHPWWALAGVMAAYEEGPDGVPTGHRQWIVVRDLADGRIVRRVPASSHGGRRVRFGEVGMVIRLLVTADGDLAWISNELPGPRPDGSYRQVVGVADRDGARVVARGAIGETSLALVGHTVYWTGSGGSHSTRLH